MTLASLLCMALLFSLTIYLLLKLEPDPFDMRADGAQTQLELAPVGSGAGADAPQLRVVD